MDIRKVERTIHESVNNVRTIRDLPALAFDEELGEIARSHSRDMADRGYVGHSTPTGSSMKDRYDRFSYDCKTPIDGVFRYATGGENIARLYWKQPSKRSDGRVVRYESVDELAHGAVWGWMNSKGHRENLLKPYWRDEGIGIVFDDPVVYITQNFC